MIFFLIKKTFFDMWDNLLKIFLINLGFVLIIALFFLLSYFASFNFILFFLIIITGALTGSIYAGAASLFMREISDYKSAGFKDFISYIKQSYAVSIFLCIIIVLFIILTSLAFSYWPTLKNMIGFVIVVILFWFCVAFVLSIQHYFAIYSRMKNGPVKTLRKCFLIFLDNPGFSIAIFIGVVFITLASVFFLLIPGIGTILLWLNNGFKLRLYKYDYLEVHPELKNKRKIPWKELLANEKENVGKRTLKGLIFPWKD
jgi:hypothetical protein